MTTMPFDHLEQAYEHLAQAIDRAGPEQEALMLARLALLLAHRHADLETFQACLADALDGLPPPRTAVK
jgi:hypothetical protein